SFRELRGRLEVGHVNDGPVQDGPARGIASIGSDRTQSLQTGDGLGIDVAVSGDLQEPAVVAHYDHALGVAEPEGVRCNGIKDRLRVCGRAADDPQDLGRGRLLFGSLGQRPLQLRMWRSCWAILASTPEVNTALQAELGARRIVLLAPGTRHAAVSRQPGWRKVGTVGRDYPPGTRMVKDTVKGVACSAGRMSPFVAPTLR